MVNELAELLGLILAFIVVLNTVYLISFYWLNRIKGVK